MSIKQANYKIRGMNRDLSESSFNPEFSFENMNLRISARDDNTLLSLTNEKGNTEISLVDINNNPFNISGLVLGKAVLNNYIILFTKGDFIYKIEYKDNKFIGSILYSGNLNFDERHPIETLSLYENEHLQKIYFTDFYNQPRMINIVASDDVKSKWSDTSFDFSQKLELKENITISKNNITSSLFPSGTVQYAFSYYNLYGQSSSIFYSSSLYYNTYQNRGGNPENTVNSSYNIEINNLDRKFDYIRIYSILRTSIDSVATVKVVADIEIKEDNIIYTDNNSTGFNIEPSLLLYIGGEELLAKTLTQKNNTLFLGNIKLIRPNLGTLDVQGTPLKDVIKGDDMTFYTKSLYTIPTNALRGIYPYNFQLNKSSSQITTFKYMETYRMGIQGQYENGRWSEPIFVLDKENWASPSITTTTLVNVNGSKILYNLTHSEVISTMYYNGFKRIRPVIVYPEMKDRTVIAQGVLNSTLFNVRDRFNNKPFAQSSWFFRPNLTTNTEDDPNYPPDGLATYPLYKGAWVEFRHNNKLLDTKNRGGEIELMTDYDVLAQLPFALRENPKEGESTYLNSPEFVNFYGENFYVDNNIVTFHSPEVEFDDNVQNLNNSSLKLRIIGNVQLTGTTSSIDLAMKTAPKSGPGLYVTPIGSLNISEYGHRGLVSAPYYLDGGVNIDTGYVAGWVLFPWQTNRALNNDDSSNPSSTYESKKMSNLKYSTFTKYLSPSDFWLAQDLLNQTKTGITPIQVFNSNEIEPLRIPKPLNTPIDQPDMNYYGNVDIIITPNKAGRKKDGYPLIISGYENDPDKYYALFEGEYTVRKYQNTTVHKSDPVRISYKSTPHIVFSFNNSFLQHQTILPSINNLNRVDNTYPVSPFWDGGVTNINQGNINMDGQYPSLWLAELYNDNVQNRFGGDTDEDIENNLWIPAGEPVSLVDENDNIKTSLFLEYTEGDTFFQRYDNLKTYQFSQTAQNSVTEILSFMVETHINIDGRYDRNRGQKNNEVMTPINFNLLNPVYNQRNNFFTYRSLNYNKYLFNYNDFPNTVTWSKSKLLGELIDNWTDINISSILELDGDKGKINYLTNYNDYLIGFQDSALFHILYNEREQISVSDGIPIEISNGNKISGRRYISSEIGTTNKWSVVKTPKGLYFIDNLSQSIYLYNGQLEELSTRLGFHSWSVNNIDNNEWNPLDFDGFISHYDELQKDVYFTNKEISLNFSETLGTFTSFFSYENTPYMFNINDKFISIKNSKLWEQNSGDYNMYFGEYKPYWITLLVNPDMPYDKIFNNVEFRSDKFDNNDNLVVGKTFDNIEVWNEYQRGEETLSNIKGYPSNLKQRFRIWRINIPRQIINDKRTLNRIRNPWIYLKLSNLEEDTYKNILHDLIIYYTI